MVVNFIFLTFLNLSQEKVMFNKIAHSSDQTLKEGTIANIRLQYPKAPIEKALPSV